MFHSYTRCYPAIVGAVAGVVLSAGAARAQCSADLNGDGHTDISDITVLLYSWGCMDDCPCGDANGDGRVNTLDLGLVVYELGCPVVGGDIGAHGTPAGGVDFRVRRVAAPAHVSDPLTPEFAGGVTHHVFDFDTVIAQQGEYVLALDVQLSTAGFTVFQHPAGGRTYPFYDDPNTCVECEAREFDSFAVNSQAFGSDGLFEFLSHETPTRLVSGWHSWFAPTAGQYWIQRLTLVTPPMVGVSLVQRTAGGGAGVGALSLSAVTIGCAPETIARIDMDILPCDRMTDVNRDWRIDLTDLSILLAHFGTPSGAMPIDGDTDLDHDVDLTDLSKLLANFGLECS